MVERLEPAAVRQSVEWMETLRETVGTDFELLVDAHARFDVASLTGSLITDWAGPSPSGSSAMMLITSTAGCVRSIRRT